MFTPVEANGYTSNNPLLPPGAAPMNAPGYGESSRAGAQSFAAPRQATRDTSSSSLHLNKGADLDESFNDTGVDPAATNDDDLDAQGKRRRVQRACDVCRRKKIRCDGLQPDKMKCTNCSVYGHDCKFEEGPKRRAPPRAYVEALEARMEKMEKLLSELAPSVDFTDRIGVPVTLPDDNSGSNGAQPTDSFKGKSLKPADSATSLAQSVLPEDKQEREQMIASLGGKAAVKREDQGSDEDDSYDVDEVAIIHSVEPQSRSDGPIHISVRSEDEQVDSASGRTPQWNLGSGPGNVSPDDRSNGSIIYLGNSSGIHLVRGLERMRGDKSVPSSTAAIRSAFWATPYCLLDAHVNADTVSRELQAIVDEYWPPADLERKLLQAYFARPHNDFPLVSEVQFKQELADPANRRDREWVLLAMAIFAVASRYVENDDRVYDSSQSNELRVNTLGARWYNAGQRIGFRPSHPNPSLRYVSAMLCNTVYLVATGLGLNVGWSMLGVVIRLLQYAGAHRKITAQRMQFPLQIAESWRRVFWVAFSLDREMSAGMGRPMAVLDEDTDIGMPLTLDDEYIWGPRASASGGIPQQPADKPAKISGFVCGLKLDEILAQVLRTIYATAKAKTKRGMVGKNFDELVVAEIDSSLNAWLDSVPQHLRYNSLETNDEWLVQSSTLYLKYYYVQVLVHRPFIAGPKMTSSLNYPSLAITTNAAKSALQIVWNLHKRGLIFAGGHLICSRAFEAGCVLLVVVSGSLKNGFRIPKSTITDIKKCQEVLEVLEERWSMAGRLNDLIRMLLSAFSIDSAFGVQNDSSTAIPKRKAFSHRADQSSIDSQADLQPNSTDTPRRIISGSGRRMDQPGQAAQTADRSSGVAATALPLSTQDLGLSPAASESVTGSVTDSPSHQATYSTDSGLGPFPKGQHPFELQQQQQQRSGSMQQQQTPAFSSDMMGAQGQQWSDPNMLGGDTFLGPGPGQQEQQQQFNFDMLSSLGPDLDQNAFASFISGGSASSFAPLDLPTFASAFFNTTGVGSTGQSGGGGGNNGMSNIGSDGGNMGGVGVSGGFDSMGQPDLGSGGGAYPSALTPGYGNMFSAGGMDFGASVGSSGYVGQDPRNPSNVGSAAPPPQQQQQQQQQQSAQASANPNDPFAGVFRELWASQDFYGNRSTP
ncbi:unnamed protein product [Jaminaea pallidilutea]